jgi:hypothetical protein
LQRIAKNVACWIGLNFFTRKSFSKKSHFSFPSVTTRQ